MDWYVVVPGAIALLFAAGGVAALRTGWVFPWLRARVFRTGLYGRGQLLMAAAFAVQALAPFSDERALRSGLGIASVLALLAGLVLMVLGQRPRHER
ncbi:hypothetical protein [Streptomyces tanashiensis]|jgi:hypothetical protein|uniref:Integral membrane protein n=1 Tax=Streptomyces tanashiensis TaxID=67367 RepID=A0ABY6R806_9ACTN|nr:hypothetical protein [Streptomyces tanashiensis]UZX25489.1 hypothetical protein LDH80_34410 [Streptomyces tanashiensis]GGY26407.1 hypothetical protein GCM10010299_35730 [Streptomyces tanashiensis]